MILSPDGEFTFANIAAADLYELPCPARGTRFDELDALYPRGEHRGARSLPFSRALELGLPVEDEVWLEKADGRIVIATVTAVPHRAVDGEVTSVSLYTRGDSVING